MDDVYLCFVTFLPIFILILQNVYEVTRTFERPLTNKKCLTLVLRGYNKVGMYSEMKNNLLNCQELPQHVILDAVGKWEYIHQNIRYIALHSQ